MNKHCWTVEPKMLLRSEGPTSHHALTEHMKVTILNHINPYPPGRDSLALVFLLIYIMAFYKHNGNQAEDQSNQDGYWLQKKAFQVS